MPKFSLNIVIVSGNSTVDLNKFSVLLTESYYPQMKQVHQNGCTLTKVLISSQSQLLENTENQISTNSSEHQDVNQYEIELNFWNLNAKEHLWSRIKALQLYEKANIFLMVYNADDRDSFLSLDSIYSDFLETNQVGSYIVLVSIISPEIIHKRQFKEIKKSEAHQYIQSKNIPSYIEVRLDTKKNMSLLDRHLKYIINPYLDTSKAKSQQNQVILYRPLFEVISLRSQRKKARKKTNHMDWVGRLYQVKSRQQLLPIEQDLKYKTMKLSNSPHLFMAHSFDGSKNQQTSRSNNQDQYNQMPNFEQSNDKNMAQFQQEEKLIMLNQQQYKNVWDTPISNIVQKQQHRMQQMKQNNSQKLISNQQRATSTRPQFNQIDIQPGKHMLRSKSPHPQMQDEESNQLFPELENYLKKTDKKVKNMIRKRNLEIDVNQGMIDKNNQQFLSNERHQEVQLRLNKDKKIEVNQIAGNEMNENQKIQYYQQLQQNYRHTANGSFQNQENLEFQKQLVPITSLSYEKSMVSDKERMYGCSKCQIF